MDCPTCKEEIDTFGACDCVPDDERTNRSEVYGFLMFMGLIIAILFGKFVVAPRLARADCLELVRERESKFLKAFQTQVNANPKLSVIGWECELVEPWGLVTYLYSDNPASKDRKAYFWCVHLERREVHRLRSLAQFVDDFLLKEAEASSP